jgi:NAD(P)-dependent dehydrogenase (short-subunit alcohol dehydrogenase family)
VNLELTDKVAVVTGAGKGIGLAITAALAGEGAQVVAASRSTGSLEGLDRVSPVALDLAAPEAPAELIRRALDEHGRIDVLVNNVGAVRLRRDGFLGYGAAKAALVNLSKSLAQEFGPKGVRVTASRRSPSAPTCGSASTALPRATGVDADTAREAVVASIGGFATGRFTTPEEVATLVTVLASARTGNVTGANYVIDGGLIKTT